MDAAPDLVIVVSAGVIVAVCIAAVAYLRRPKG